MFLINTLTCRALLFDLDGVLVDSRRCIEFVWQSWAAAHGRDPQPIIASAHGRRTEETLRAFAPELDIPAEVAVLDRMEEQETRGLAPVAGAAELLARLKHHQWAIVTSGSPTVARLRLGVAGIAAPPVFVTAADVERGKPSPDGYLQAAARLGVAPEDCVVLEDSVVGVAAGTAGGMQVVAVEGTTVPGDLADAAIVVRALDRLRIIRQDDGGLLLTVRAV